jgi:hypothetical protein
MCTCHAFMHHLACVRPWARAVLGQSPWDGPSVWQCQAVCETVCFCGACFVVQATKWALASLSDHKWELWLPGLLHLSLESWLWGQLACLMQCIGVS